MGIIIPVVKTKNAGVTRNLLLSDSGVEQAEGALVGFIALLLVRTASAIFRNVVSGFSSGYFILATPQHLHFSPCRINNNFRAVTLYIVSVQPLTGLQFPANVQQCAFFLHIVPLSRLFFRK